MWICQISNKTPPLRLASFLLLISMSTFSGAATTLDQVITRAIKNDPWLQGNQLQEQALYAISEQADTLPDPVMSVGVANLPTDGLAFNQEPMTQFKIGIAQQFPRGESRAIRKKQLQQMASRNPQLREDRKAKVKVTVSQLWLDAFMAEQSVNLIEKDRGLFEQLADIVQVNYSSAQGKTRQQDVVRSQLELSRIDDRLTRLRSQRDVAIAKLMEWSPVDGLQTFSLPDNWPEQPLIHQHLRSLLLPQNQQQLANLLMSHPAALAVERNIKAHFTSVRLAQQKYQPQWGLNASYAFRDNEPTGRSRADFFSVGVTFDLPLFTQNRQDQEVESARLEAESSKTEKRLLLRNMMAKLDGLFQRYQRLQQRIEHFQRTILPQMREQSDASLSAYTNNDGDFTEVMRARIEQLNTRIENIELKAEQYKTAFQINYFFAGEDVPSSAVQGAF